MRIFYYLGMNFWVNQCYYLHIWWSSNYQVNAKFPRCLYKLLMCHKSKERGRQSALTKSACCIISIVFRFFALFFMYSMFFLQCILKSLTHWQCITNWLTWHYYIVVLRVTFDRDSKSAECFLHFSTRLHSRWHTSVLRECNVDDLKHLS